MTKKWNNWNVDDIFIYNFKKSMLLFLLLAWLFLIIGGLSFHSDITTNNKKILSEKFFLMKLSDTYATAKKIDRDSKFWKIDVFKVNNLLNIITLLKQDLSKKWEVQIFKINTLNFARRYNKSVSIHITVILNSKELVFNLLNYYIENSILSKEFNVSYANWKWLLTATLQIYYEWKLTTKVYNKFKEKTEKTKNNKVNKTSKK